MNANHLLELYEQISEAPNAISRLRRFVLDLAVRGKLVEQDPVDGSALELLTKIASEKAELVKRGEIKKPKALGPINEVPFNLPSTWHWKKLGVISSYIQRGKSPKYSPGSGIPVVSQKCVQWSGLDLTVAKEISEESFEKYENIRILRDGDLLWNSTGTGTIGRVLIVNEPPKGLVCDSHVTVVRPVKVAPGYLCIWLRTDHVYGRIEGSASGSTNQIELTATLANNQPVPVPPLAEQHRIVAKVDELMVLCDRLEESRKTREKTRDKLTAASLARLTAPEASVASETDGTNAPSGTAPNQAEPENAETGPLSGTATAQPSGFPTHARFAIETLPALTSRPDQIKSLRQTILNLAVRGKLVEQDPADGSGDELLRQIRERKNADVDPQELKRSAKFNCDKEDLPFELPQSWSIAALRELSYNLGDGLHGTPNYIATGNINFINGTNLRNGRITLLPNTKKVSRDEFEKHAKPLNERTLLVSINGTLTNFAFYKGEHVLLGKSACYFEISPLMDMQFVRVLIQTPYYIEYAIQQSTGATIKNLSLKAMNSFPVPLPPLAEQHRIVAKVDALMALCDRLEAALTTADTTRTRLLEALLHEALEPAEKTLEAAE
jgi:type I restriction enzyme S subunit